MKKKKKREVAHGKGRGADLGDVRGIEGVGLDGHGVGVLWRWCVGEATRRKRKVFVWFAVGEKVDRLLSTHINDHAFFLLSPFLLFLPTFFFVFPLSSLSPFSLSHSFSDRPRTSCSLPFP